MNDWVRVPLTIQKVNVRVLKEEGMEVAIIVASQTGLAGTLPRPLRDAARA